MRKILFVGIALALLAGVADFQVVRGGNAEPATVRASVAPYELHLQVAAANLAQTEIETPY